MEGDPRLRDARMFLTKFSLGRYTICVISLLPLRFLTLITSHPMRRTFRAAVRIDEEKEKSRVREDDAADDQKYATALSRLRVSKLGKAAAED